VFLRDRGLNPTEENLIRFFQADARDRSLEFDDQVSAGERDS
jgi:hypothetical protein